MTLRQREVPADMDTTKTLDIATIDYSLDRKSNNSKEQRFDLDFSKFLHSMVHLANGTGDSRRDTFEILFATISLKIIK